MDADVRDIVGAVTRTLAGAPPQRGLDASARLLVHGLGDFCVIDVVDDHGHLVRAAWAAADAARRTIGAELFVKYPPDSSQSPVVARVLTQRTPEVESDTADEHWRRVARDDEHLALIRALHLRSSVAVPLMGRREAVGLLRVSSGAPARFGADEVNALVDVGRALGLAVEAQRLARAEEAARADAQRAQSRLRITETASGALASGRDLDRTLRAVAELVVPTLADWCSIDVVDGERLLRRARAAPPGNDDLSARAESYLPALDDIVGEAEVVRHGAPILVPVLDDDMLALYARDEGHLAVLKEIAPRSTMLAPIRTDGAAFGCMSFTRGAARAPFDDDDLGLAIDLAQRVGWAVENARLHDLARATAAERDEAMSIVGHELKTPLTALRLGLDLLGRQLGPAAPSAHEQVARMKRQVTRVAALVDELVEEARAGAGRLDVERAPVDVADLVAEVVRRLEPVAAEAGCPLAVRSAGPAVIVGDRARLERVMTNLVGNACKYAAGKPIAVSVEIVRDVVRVAVEDTGPGFDADDLPHLFDRYRRGRRPGAPGLGLGLWLAKQIVDAHRGTIAAHTRAGGGGTVLVTLPLSS